MSRFHFLLPSVFCLLVLAACDCDDWDDCGCAPPPPPAPRPVSILVEVYDPVTNGVWENVLVRIVEADQEWSGCTCVSPTPTFFATDRFGQVFLDEYLLAWAQVGFVEDPIGRALLRPGSREDQATVVLEISAPGFTTVIVEVPLSWSAPDVFVEVPFS